MMLIDSDEHTHVVRIASKMWMPPRNTQEVQYSAAG